MLVPDGILFTTALQNTTRMIKMKPDKMYAMQMACEKLRTQNKFSYKIWKETVDEMIMIKCIRQTGWYSVDWVHLGPDMNQGSCVHSNEPLSNMKHKTIGF
jgi:hypothetical protein